MKNLLLFGYGNPDRGDDGAAFHILLRLFQDFGVQDPDIFSADVLALNKETDTLFNFQLLPEYADLVTHYEKVIFIDAHTAEIADEMSIKEVKADYQYSPFTHHFSPSSCLAVAKSLTGNAPEAWLISIRGYQFGFSRVLSDETSALVDRAVAYIKDNFLE